MLSNKSIEQYPVFPYIAWGIILSFSFFVFELTQNLLAVTEDIRHNTTELEIQVHQDPATITIFNRD
jgi:hypothetical protein